MNLDNLKKVEPVINHLTRSHDMLANVSKQSCRDGLDLTEAEARGILDGRIAKLEAELRQLGFVASASRALPPLSFSGTEPQEGAK